MSRLFTDSTMSQVSEEFNTLEKVEKLELEAKEHPFYNDYKEDIENAKLIIENKEVQYTDAKVSDFLNPDNELLKAYDAIYKLDKSKIKSIKTNGGQYASESIDKAIDGDFNTKWHSGKQNTENFTNEVEIELEVYKLKPDISIPPCHKQIRRHYLPHVTLMHILVILKSLNHLPHCLCRIKILRNNVNRCNLNIKCVIKLTND